ncbi:hypothetical protein CHGG_03182 [Chaetomium globosum CBS 148.51]|uniref:Exonuclease domain-containing protein n=1 Tax=Chaetomium globosum (strain ATCC 6205 / CBS 148.51 / DSM 1962 / NBRC 6347 / NRRL 1970) TaxID=306901 RepID=Q2H9C2_CHAGB|nr:uncharacterized protein CHGG_03182 [Chaetomium globosum CBS 148.51]EAQ91247.1 hypothetical protein CHGG_03182 [Chaetomium globosum CBS 148.51]
MANITTGYRARTFTFQLTPEFFPPNTALAKLIDRKLVLSYRSFLFLQENNFSFEKTFFQGVPYLSRSEGELANSLYPTKPQHANAPAEDSPPQKSWDSEYRKRHHSVVRQTGKPINIPLAPHPRLTPNPGFRYIIEALIGGSFADALDPELLLDNNHLPPTTASQLRQNLHLYEARLRAHRPILIGHNPFLDLCFLHETFLQPLPADALAFRRATHRFFPRIIDTKHLACQLGWKPSRNLAQLYADLVGRGSRIHPKPQHHRHHHHQQPPSPPPFSIIPEPGFDPRERGMAHSAGFDSWMTAVVFVVLSGRVLTTGDGGGGGVGSLIPPPPLRGLRRDGGKGKGDELFRELCPFGGGGGGGGGGGLKGGGERPSSSSQWDGEIWRRYGNKLRMGAVGVMDLAREES